MYSYSFKPYMNILFDRFHLSELAYSRFFGRVDYDYAIDSFVTIEKELLKSNKDIMLFTFLAETKNIMSRGKEKKRNWDYSEDDVNQLTSLFIRAHDMSRIEKKFLIDTDGMTIKQTSAEVLKRMEL